jgi:hypothetical protein
MFATAALNTVLASNDMPSVTTMTLAGTPVRRPLVALLSSADTVRFRAAPVAVDVSRYGALINADEIVLMSYE